MVCIWNYTHACVSVYGGYMLVYIEYGCMCTYMLVCIYNVYIFVCMWVSMCVGMYVCICNCVCMHVCIHVCMHVCMSACVCKRVY